MSIVFTGVFDLIWVKIDVGEIIDHILCGLKRVLRRSILSFQCLLCAISYLSEDVDHLDLLRGEVILICCEFSFDLNLPAFVC